MSELDSLIKKSLSENISITTQEVEDSYLKFEERIKSKKNILYPFLILKILDYKKIVLASAACLLCLSLLLVGTSGDVRAAALDVINNVKMLFVTERIGDEIKIVQKPSSEVNLQPAVFKRVYISDVEISKLIGYKIKFPELIANSFELQERILFLGLSREISYADKNLFANKMEAAIENQKEFEELSSYNPYRGTSGLYKYTRPDNKFGVYFQISFWPKQSNLEAYSKDQVKIGDIKGYWLNVKYPEYPWMPAGHDNLINRPAIKEDFYRLVWLQDGLTFAVQILNETNVKNIDKDAAIEIAKEFIKAQTD